MIFYKVTVDANTYEVGVEEIGGDPEIRTVQAAASISAKAPVAAANESGTPAPAENTPIDTSNAQDIAAPLPGTVISVNVAVGDHVQAGQLLLVFEAMKMENELVAPCDGAIARVHVAKGDALESGKKVITIA